MVVGDHFQKVISCWCLFHQPSGIQTTQKKKLASQLEKKISLDRNPHLDPLSFFLNEPTGKPPGPKHLEPPKKPPAAPVFRGLIGFAGGARSWKQCLQQLLREFRGVEGSEGVEGGEGGGMDGWLYGMAPQSSGGCQFYTLRVYRLPLEGPRLGGG